MTGKQILIVDDEERTCFCISLALKMKGYRTVVADNGERALQIIRECRNTQAPVDLMVCDIQMPKLGGEELIDKLNELKIKVPTVVITGFGEKDLVVRLMRKGCRDFVDKPFEPADIEDRIRMILAQDDKVALENRRTETMARIGVRTSQIVHDMNNVLCGTLGYADMAIEGTDEDHPNRRILTKLAGAVNRASQICRTLLAATRCTDEPSLVATEMTSLVQRTGDILKDVISSGIAVEVDTGVAPLWCKANAERIQQAILNLGMNAADAMPTGGRLALECSRAVRGGQTTVRIVVSDTGTGIPEAVRSRIFDLGFTTKKTGTGLGLNTVNEIVNEHNGTIQVASAPGAGTVFAIDIQELPINQA